MSNSWIKGAGGSMRFVLTDGRLIRTYLPWMGQEFSWA